MLSKQLFNFGRATKTENFLLNSRGRVLYPLFTQKRFRESQRKKPHKPVPSKGKPGHLRFSEQNKKPIINYHVPEYLREEIQLAPKLKPIPIPPEHRPHPEQRWFDYGQNELTLATIEQHENEIAEYKDNTFIQFVEKYTEQEVAAMTLEEIEEQINAYDILGLLLTLPEHIIRHIYSSCEYEIFPFFLYIKDQADAHKSLMKYDPDRKEVDIDEMELIEKCELLGKDPDNEEDRLFVKELMSFQEKAMYAVDDDYQEIDKEIEDIRKNFVTSHCGDKMWQLHKAHPRYWTGDRLGRAFGVPRRRAWGEIIMRELDEAKRLGKPFCYDKLKLIFHHEKRASYRLKRKHVETTTVVAMRRYLTEDDAYKNFLEATSKEGLPGGYDDELPDWAAIPFQTRDSIETYEPKTVSLPQFEGLPNRGTHTVKKRIVFVEYGKHVDKDVSTRRFMVRDPDGTLRTATWAEKDYVQRKGTFPKWNGGHGKAKFRRLRKKRINPIIGTNQRRPL